MGRWLKVLFAAGVSAVVLLVLDVIPVPEENMLWRRVFDAGHAPLFGCFSVVVLWMSVTVFGRFPIPRVVHYAVAFVVTCCAGVVTEAIQYFTPRDADPMDFLRDVFGAFVFLMLAASFDRKLIGRRRLWLYPLRVFFVLLLFVPAVPAAVTYRAYGERDAAFPRLLDFEAKWEKMFYEVKEARLSLEPLPAPWNEDPGNLAAHVSFSAGGYPRIVVVEPCPDWSDYETLVFDVYSPNDEPVEVLVKVQDEAHNGRFRDRLNKELVLEPGHTRVEIPTWEMREAPHGREMDLTKIKHLSVFADDPDDPFDLYFDAFRLEK